MKKITFFSLVTFLMLLFSPTMSYGQEDLRTCDFDCTSNNYTVESVYLVLVSVDNVMQSPPFQKLVDVIDTCTDEVYGVTLGFDVSSNQNNSVYNARLYADLLIDGQPVPPGASVTHEHFLGELPSGTKSFDLYTLNNGQLKFDWTCGQELQFSNMFMAWTVNNQKDLETEYACKDYSNSQCEFNADIINVLAPLSVDFDYAACTDDAGNTDVVFTSDVTNGTSPYTYAWTFVGGDISNSTLSNPTVTFSGGGPYSATLVVTDSEGRTNDPVVKYITIPLQLIVSASETQPTCAGVLGEIDITAAGGKLPYTYDWDTDGTGDFDDNEDLSGLTAGTYTVVVKDAFDCEATIPITIIDATAPTADTSGDIIACDSYTLPVLSANNNYFTDSGGAGSPYFANDIISTSIPTMYIYAVNGVCTDESSFSITINDTPTADDPADVTECDTYTLPALSSGNAYWTAIGGASGTGTEVAAGTAITTTTTLYVYAAATAPCVADENELLITIVDTPSIEVSSINVTCYGENDGTISVSGLGDGEDYIIQLNGTGNDLSNQSTFGPGTYLITASSSSNDQEEVVCSTTEEVVITQPSQIFVDAGPNQLLTCSNPTATLIGTASTTDQIGLNYFWTTSNGVIDSGTNTPNAIVSAPGIYTLTVMSDNECSVSDTVVVSQNIVTPEVDVITNITELNCEITSITLTGLVTSIQGSPSYLWSTGETTPFIEVTEPGEYMFIVIDSQNGCYGFKKIEITQNISQPEAIILGNGELTCATTEIMLDASTSVVQGEASYLWSTGAVTSTINVTEPGTYEVTITDSDNGCSAIATVEVRQNATVFEVTITGNEELNCATTEIMLDASASTIENPSYLWNTGATTTTLAVSAPGVYSVTVLDLDTGCSEIAEVTVVQDITAVVVIISGNEELTCFNTVVTLDASGSTIQGEASYLWSTGETTASIDVTEPGSYTVAVTDSDNGCSGSLTVEVSQDNTPDEIVGGTIELCIEDEIYDLTNLLGENFVPGGTWVDDNNSGGLNGDFFDPSIVNLETYQFTYTEPGDCGRIIKVYVSVNDDCVVLPCSTDDLTISKVLTPNNDGFNDAFELLGLEGCGFTFEVQIFNRWGKIVYESNNYQNNWRGYANNSGMTIGSSSKLPTGTYYYIVNVMSSGFNPITGYIYLGTH